MGKVLFYMAIVSSVLSQVPFILASDFGVYLKLVWIFPFLYFLFVDFRSFLNRRLLSFYVFLFVFFLFCFFSQGITGVKYMGADLYNIAVSCLITSVAFVFWHNYVSRQVLYEIVFFLLISALLLSFSVYTDFLVGSSLLDRTYAYNSKNSLGQILLAVSLIAFVVLVADSPRSKWIKILYLFSILFLLVVVILLRSRATILGLGFLYLYFLLKSKNRRVKLLLVFGGIVGIVGVFFNSEVYKVLVDGILFAGRDSSDINELSSGRVGLIGAAIAAIPDHLLLGNGIWYIDCFPVAMILQYGLLGGGIVFAFLLKIFKFVQFELDKDNPVNLAAMLLFWIFILNSLFEAQAPFGPGVKCFLLWMMLGFSLSSTVRFKSSRLAGVQS